MVRHGRDSHKTRSDLLPRFDIVMVLNREHGCNALHISNCCHNKGCQLGSWFLT